ncbi:MAG: peptidylprolyl isomerase [Tannerella sp.]|jgi:peptidyl-prolyl cis-trans isomerase SurA|nr:peptidylprolyl isomerase [Tannerella sp.]
MKKVFVLILFGLTCCFVYSQEKEDPVVMTIADKEIPLSEFLFLAQKDEGVNLLDKKSLENYVELFKNFKLKVADAESEQMDKAVGFKNELSNYEDQLKKSLLADKEGESRAARAIYDRGKNIRSVSHIIFQLPKKIVSKDTVAVYNKAKEAYERILAGENFMAVGQALESENDSVFYEEVDYLFPMKSVKAFENAAYSLSVGEISQPVRTSIGFHLIRVNKIVPDPGKIQVAHILVAPAEGEEFKDEELLQKANEAYEKAINGDDFSELVKTYSADYVENEEDVMPYFGLGEMVKPFEEAAFSLKEIGEIAKPFKTRFGYHIVKLTGKKESVPFEEMEHRLTLAMDQGEWTFELHESFVEREKRKYGYQFNADAYNDLQKLCDDYYPTDTAFYNRAYQMSKVLMHMNGVDFPQSEFADFIKAYPLSTKSYSGDFLFDVYRLFVKTIAIELEKRDLEKGFPEYNKLMQEYRDGILLFEISSKKIWNKPVEEQLELEKQWIKDLNKRFETKINWKVLKNIKEYI